MSPLSSLTSYDLTSCPSSPPGATALLAANSKIKFVHTHPSLPLTLTISQTPSPTLTLYDFSRDLILLTLSPPELHHSEDHHTPTASTPAHLSSSSTPPPTVSSSDLNFTSIFSATFLDASSLSHASNLNPPYIDTATAVLPPTSVIMCTDVGIYVIDLRLNLQSQLSTSLNIRLITLAVLQHPTKTCENGQISCVAVTNNIFAVIGGDQTTRFYDLDKHILVKTMQKPKGMKGAGSIGDIVLTHGWLSAKGKVVSADTAPLNFMNYTENGYCFFYSLSCLGNIISNDPPIAKLEGLEKIRKSEYLDGGVKGRVVYDKDRDWIVGWLKDGTVGVFKNPATGAGLGRMSGACETVLPLFKFALPLLTMTPTLTSIVLNKDPFAPSPSFLVTNRTTSEVHIVTVASTGSGKSEVQAKFDLKNIYDSEESPLLPSKLKIYSVSVPSCDPTTIVFGTNNGSFVAKREVGDMYGGGWDRCHDLCNGDDNDSANTSNEYIHVIGGEVKVRNQTVYIWNNGASEEPPLLNIYLSPSKSFCCVFNTVAGGFEVFDVESQRKGVVCKGWASQFVWVGSDVGSSSGESYALLFEAKKDNHANVVERKVGLLRRMTMAKKKVEEEVMVGTDPAYVELWDIEKDKAQAKNLGRVNCRGSPVALFGGPLLMIGNVLGNAQFYGSKKKTTDANSNSNNSLVALGPTLPSPDSILWNETGSLFSISVDGQIFVYRNSTKGGINLICTSRISPSHVNCSLQGGKWLGDTLVLSTSGEVVVVFVAEGKADLVTVCGRDSDGIGMTNIIDVDVISLQGCRYPEVVGIEGRDLVLFDRVKGGVKKVEGVFKSYALRAGMLMQSGEVERGEEVLRREGEEGGGQSSLRIKAFFQRRREAGGWNGEIVGVN